MHGQPCTNLLTRIPLWLVEQGTELFASQTTLAHSALCPSETAQSTAHPWAASFRKLGATLVKFRLQWWGRDSGVAAAWA